MSDVKGIEEQPLPVGASAEANARFQTQVNAFGQALMRKFQLGGNQFNPLELELRVFVLIEQVNLLTEIIKKLATGEHTDETLTDAMALRMEAVTRNLMEALEKAPRLAIAGGTLPSRMNGSKHN